MRLPPVKVGKRTMLSLASVHCLDVTFISAFRHSTLSFSHPVAMWLLDTKTLMLRHFITNIPDYVILSHTWGEDEVSFDDIAQPHAKDMVGYSKILRCCIQAVEAGFEWAWVDTCCIDKRSSAELSEAINSMYGWYWNAAICYVFLSDRSGRDEDFESSRWFSRGWTLQELLAPDVIEFYDSDWTFLGTKKSLVDEIFAATKIDKRCLLDRTAIENASIAARLSWASERGTTREEDTAYCLLGLVQVNMPMLYGEGTGAFYRLQLEIIKQTNDHTIFAWSPLHTASRFTGMFATSPAHFANAAGFRPRTTQTQERQPVTHEMTNRGLSITMPLMTRGAAVVALLDCTDSSGMYFGVQLKLTGPSTYRRLGMSLAKMGQREAKDAYLKPIYIETGSRSLQEKVPKIDALRVYNTSEPGRIQRIATGTFAEVFPYQQEVFYETQDNDLRQSDFISTLSDQVVRECDFISFVFMLDGLFDYLFFLGLHDGRSWIQGSPCVPARWFEEVEEKRKDFEAAVKEGPVTREHQQHFTDYLSFPIEGGRMLQVLARRTRSEGRLQWSVDISIV